MMIKNLKITVNGTAYDVQVEDLGASAAPAQAPAAPAPKTAAPAAPAAPAAAAAPAPKPAAPADGETVASPMPGTIVSTNVKPGQSVKKGDVLVVLEAMKMENEIMAPHDAQVAAVLVNKGDSVESGTPLVTLQ
ncbi:MAG: Biotin carboxyl carrier protein of acetyl-CoA carboxylase [Clostridium sp.]|jgi:glutaconyl-CoA/methylmalonyl-CoA decarboxylase subunit gamma